MTLVLEREQEFVNQYHYDARNLEWEAENGTPETNLNVQFQTVEAFEKATENDTAINTVLTFLIVLDEFVISGFVSQLSVLKDRKVVESEEIDQEDMQQLASPLFELLRRLTMETTEVALDRPGINLEF